MKDFLDLINNTALEIDKFLDDNLPNGQGLNLQLFQAMRYSSIDAGKKIRAFLVIESARFLSVINKEKISQVKYNELIAVASAIEAIHSYSLIHDDLPAMDNSSKRRGKPSNHIRFDEHTAILAGDALQSWAFQIISDSIYIKNSKKRSELSLLLAKAIGPSGMAGGQQADMDSSKMVTLNLDDIEWIQNHKTGALISYCSHAAAIVLDAKIDQRIALINYANYLGLAFQIADDLLDVNGDENLIGKPVLQDIQNKTPNFVTMLGKDNAQKKAIEVSSKAIESIKRFDCGIENLVSLAKYTVKRSY
jgi:farnesyl diphosphate synthase